MLLQTLVESRNCSCTWHIAASASYGSVSGLQTNAYTTYLRDLLNSYVQLRGRRQLSWEDLGTA